MEIGFIGYGNMAKAIIASMLSNNFSGKINIYDIDANKTKELSNSNIIICKSIDAVIENSTYIFFAIKPQQLTSVLSSITISLENKIIVTILAGVSTNYFRELSNNNLKIIRAMPNTPLLLNEGATALCKTNNVTDDEFQFVKNIFENSGSVAIIPDEQMNAIISINGSSPAYIFLFASAVTDYAKQQGISEQIALKLFSQTLIGSAKMMLESGKTPEELREMVSSPGGTTLAALDILYRNSFEEIIKSAMDACTNRAKELGK